MCPGFRSEPTCDQIVYLIIKHLIVNLREKQGEDTGPLLLLL